MTEDPFVTLERGPLHRFEEWPNPAVPRVAAGVYTVWLASGNLLYTGMSGRGLRLDAEGGGRKGLWTRLDSHASGRRSGDQFCVYVCDRLIVPRLTDDQLRQVGLGGLSLDALTREFIRSNLMYRFVVTADAATAFAIERAVQGGALKAGKPLLNPVAT